MTSHPSSASPISASPISPSPITLQTLDLDRLNQRFAKLGPKDILAWCVQNVPMGLVQTSRFGVDDIVITDLLYRGLCAWKPVPVLFVDTLFHFSQTLQLVLDLETLYDLNLKVYRTPEADCRVSFAEKFGDALWQSDLPRYRQITQQEPLERGLQELGAIAWIVGHVGQSPIFSRDAQQRLVVNPLATWNRRETWAYVFEHDLLYNSLHDQGYAQIEDEPLTKPATIVPSI